MLASAQAALGPYNMASDASAGKVTYAQLGAHNSKRDCWVALCGTVYDLTAFAAEHPGGGDLITDIAGTDGTAPFLDAHERSMLLTPRVKSHFVPARVA